MASPAAGRLAGWPLIVEVRREDLETSTIRRTQLGAHYEDRFIATPLHVGKGITLTQMLMMTIGFFFALLWLMLALAQATVWNDSRSDIPVLLGLTGFFLASGAAGLWRWRAAIRRRQQVVAWFDAHPDGVIIKPWYRALRPPA